MFVSRSADSASYISAISASSVFYYYFGKILNNVVRDASFELRVKFRHVAEYRDSVARVFFFVCTLVNIYLSICVICGLINSGICFAAYLLITIPFFIQIIIPQIVSGFRDNDLS